MSDPQQETQAETQLLENLEQRWNAMGEMIRRLQGEKQHLQQTLAERDETITQLNQQLLEKGQQVDGLQTQRSQVLERIEGLLGRFEDLET